MKICLLGEYSGDLDEGMRNASSSYAKLLSVNHQVLTLDIRKAYKKELWNEIKAFSPDIIHYIHGPTINSLILVRILSFYCNNKPVCITSAMRPYFTTLSKQLIPFFRPDLVLTQSLESEKYFKSKGCMTKFVASGVNVNKFIPIDKRTKSELKSKYGIEENKFVILHIGSIKEGRNIKLLADLQYDNNQVIIVGAVSPGINKNLVMRLENSGCIIWTEYFENIEEIYGLADCYVFPTLAKSDAFGRAAADSIEMPLTVLEAMSCNLPVIATKFCALPRAFEQGDGLFFVDSPEKDLTNTIEIVKRNCNMIETRKKVIPYSWERVTDMIENIYKEIVST